MNQLIALVFVLLALLVMGVYFISNDRRLHQSSHYWSNAVLMDAGGLTLIGLIFYSNNFFAESSAFARGIISLSNGLLFGSLVFQTISIQAIRASVSARTVRIAWALVVAFYLAWTVLAWRITVSERIFTFAMIALLMIAIQAHLVLLIRKAQPSSRQVKLLLITLSGEFFFTSARAWTVLRMGNEVIAVDQLPILGLLVTWLHYGLKIIVYGSLLAYWSESLSLEKAQAESERNILKKLSEKQHRQIEALSKLNKTLNAGWMSASITHELSQPLQSLVLNNTLLRSEFESPSPNLAFLEEMATRQTAHVSRMTEIMSTLRAMFSVAHPNSQDTDLLKIMDNLALLLGPQAEKLGITCEYECTQNVRAHIEANEIQQVFLNLMGNAMDALQNSQIDQPRIRVTLRQTTDVVMVCVEDNGPGIAPAMQAHVFDFLSSSKPNGMGLGLWLSKYIVERNGGAIRVQPSPLGGAQFTVELPLAKSPTISPPATSPES